MKQTIKREKNAKGVTLSAGVSTDKPVVTATGSKKSEPAPKIENPSTVVDPTTGEEIKVRRSIVPNRFKAEYSKHGGTCGDDMALELKAATTTVNADQRPCLDLPAIKAIAEANGINWRPYEGLNNGQWRMNIGNKLRGRLAKGLDVKVGKRTFKAEDYEPKPRPVKAKPADAKAA